MNPFGRTPEERAAYLKRGPGDMFVGRGREEPAPEPPAAPVVQEESTVSVDSAPFRAVADGVSDILRGQRNLRVRRQKARDFQNELDSREAAVAAREQKSLQDGAALNAEVQNIKIERTRVERMAQNALAERTANQELVAIYRASRRWLVKLEVAIFVTLAVGLAVLVNHVCGSHGLLKFGG